MVNRLWAWASLLPAPVRRLAKALPGSTSIRDFTVGRPRGRVIEGGPAPVVYLPTWLEWDVMKQRPQYLMETMAAAGHPVFFVDPRLKAPQRRGLVSLVPGLGPVPRTDVILYAHFAPSLSLTRRFQRPTVWYDYLDDLSIYAAADSGLPRYRQTATHHLKAVRNADIVTCSSPVLLERVGRADAVLVENGVDVERFRPGDTEAADLPVSGPIVGFHGAVGPWFDFRLLAALVRSRPDYEFVIVGPVDPAVANRTVAAPNLHWFGARHPDQVPAYVRGFDVGIIPFVVDDLTRGVSPLKMYEYLAAGKAVVSTPLPAALEQAEVVVASEPGPFAEALDRALEAGADTRRLEAAAGAAWERRIEPLLQRLDSIGRR